MSYSGQCDVSRPDGNRFSKCVCEQSVHSFGTFTVEKSSLQVAIASST